MRPSNFFSGISRRCHTKRAGMARNIAKNAVFCEALTTGWEYVPNRMKPVWPSAQQGVWLKMPAAAH